MKRLIDYHLNEWKKAPQKKPIILRGARQVGKTYAARILGQQFDNFIELNLERLPAIRKMFDEDLNPHRILKEIGLYLEKPINIESTLLFFDEIQAAPKAILALRYFYEEMPELHVIAAGSLLDFAIEEVGMPVGRVQSLYVYPMSFIEFLVATNHALIAAEIITHSIRSPMPNVIHNKILKSLGEYIAIGGMPEAVACWKQHNDFFKCSPILHTLIDTYRQDFSKYARTAQVKYVELVFNQIPLQLGQKFKYSAIDGDYRKRELAPALDLLVTAGIAHKVYNSSGQGIPLGAQIDPSDYKINFVDVGLSENMLSLDTTQWFLNPLETFINKSALVESFVGQEILAYSNAHMKGQLFYWQRKSRGSQAEVDYLKQLGHHIVPIEVKSGPGTSLKSMRMFLETHKDSPFGIRLSTQNYSKHEQLYSYPLYAIAHILSAQKPEVKKALEYLIG